MTDGAQFQGSKEQQTEFCRSSDLEMEIEEQDLIGVEMLFPDDKPRPAEDDPSDGA